MVNLNSLKGLSFQHKGVRAAVFLAVLAFLLLGFQWTPTYSRYYSNVGNPTKKTLNVVLNWGDRNPERRFWAFEIVIAAAALSNRPVNVVVEIEGQETAVEDSVTLAFKSTYRYIDAIAKHKAVNPGHMANIALLRIGDEQQEDIPEAYDVFDYVLRVYASYEGRRDYWDTPTAFDPSLKKVNWIPNGWGENVGPRDPRTHIPTSQRPELCYFSGGGHTHEMFVGDRKWMFDVLTKMGDHGCMLPGRSDPYIYAAELSRTKYALCPGGNVPETIRFWESLENGAIPIIVQELWMRQALGHLPLELPEGKRWPFPVLRSWEELPALLQRLNAEPAEVHDARQAATVQWWSDLKDELRRKTNRLIDGAFEAKYGPGA